MSWPPPSFHRPRSKGFLLCFLNFLYLLCLIYSANARPAVLRPTAPAAKGSCVTLRSALHAATRRSLPANASARLVCGSYAGLSSYRVQPVASILDCLASVAAASHRLDAPSKARSQWPAAATALRAFLLSHDAFLPAQILPPACWAICLRVRPHALFLPLVSLPHRAYVSPVNVVIRPGDKPASSLSAKPRN